MRLHGPLRGHRDCYDGKVVRLEADDDHPNGGVFCLKGKAAPELVYHPDRLNYPLNEPGLKVMPIRDGNGLAGMKRSMTSRSG